jgi:hypothetical protein
MGKFEILIVLVALISCSFASHHPLRMSGTVLNPFNNNTASFNGSLWNWTSEMNFVGQVGGMMLNESLNMTGNLELISKLEGYFWLNGSLLHSFEKANSVLNFTGSVIFNNYYNRSIFFHGNVTQKMSNTTYRLWGRVEYPPFPNDTTVQEFLRRKQMN